MRIRKINLPNPGIQFILIGGIIRLITWILNWPIELIVVSDLGITMGVTWVLVYDFLPYFMPPFAWLAKHFRKKDSFLFIQLAVSIIARGFAYFLPAGNTQSQFWTVSFYSFVGA